jgi:hypothetical protein
MNDQESQGLNFYQAFRFDEQQRWYQMRADEYESAQRQAGLGSATFLVLSALAAALGVANVGGHRPLWAVGAAVMAAVSAAITSYAASFQYDTLAQSYERAADALGLIAPERPGLDSIDGDIGSYVDRVEAILLGEVDSWREDVGTSRGAPPRSDPNEEAP